MSCGHPTRRTRDSIALATICLLFTGCIEQSTVVKVKRDGSGVVHIRLHAQESSILNATKEWGKEKSDVVGIPPLNQLQALAQQMGPNVRLMTAESTINRNGWEGYDLI